MWLCRWCSETPACWNLSRMMPDGASAALTGYSSRAVAALAHLREAWASADDGNATSIELAIRAMLNGHSLRECSGVCAFVLAHRLDVGQVFTLLSNVGLERFGADVLAWRDEVST